MLTARVLFVETADCETDGDLSFSGLQDSLEAGGSNAPGTTRIATQAAANGLPIPALRFPSVSGLQCRACQKSVEGTGRGRWRQEGRLFIHMSQCNTVLTGRYVHSVQADNDGHKAFS